MAEYENAAEKDFFRKFIAETHGGKTGRVGIFARVDSAVAVGFGRRRLFHAVRRVRKQRYVFIRQLFADAVGVLFDFTAECRMVR